MRTQDGKKMSKLVFIGIKAAKEIAEACAELQKSVADLPVRFTPQKDIHLTLLPPREMADRREIEEKIKNALLGAEKFTIEFKRMAYGPDKRQPRLIWIEGVFSPELGALKEKLSNAFGAKDARPFTPHMTIARFSEKDRGKLVNRPVEKQISFFMPVESVEFFASPRDGSGYHILKSFKLL